MKSRLVSGAAFLVGVASILMLDDTSRATFTIGLPCFDVAAAVLVLRCASGSPGRLGWLLETRRARALGRISYGVYLWNAILIYATPFPAIIGACLSVVVAAASYQFVERPFLRRKRPALAAGAARVGAAAALTTPTS